MTSYEQYIGIDISKKTFIVGFYGEKNVKEYDNSQAGFESFLKTINVEKAFYNDPRKVEQ